MIQIYPVCSAIVKEGVGTIANVIKVPVKDGQLFEAATIPAMLEMDRDEPGTFAYILAKSHDGSTYFFLEIFKDESAIAVHSKLDTFKAMGQKQRPALKGAPGGKPDFSLTNLVLCGNAPRKRSVATVPSKL